MTEKGEKHKVAGTSYRQKEIKSLGTLNPDYQLNKSQLVKKGLIDVKVYEYKFKKLKAELVPEPTNPKDPNAVKVIINGKHVGYIKSGRCSHVKKLIGTNSIKSVTATMKGGNNKRVFQHDDGGTMNSYTLDSDKGDIGVEIVVETTQESNAPSKNTSKQSNPAAQKTAAAAPKTKQEQYEEIVRKGNLTKKKTKSYKTLFTIISLIFILSGLVTLPLGIIFLALSIFFICFARLYGNILKNCFKD